MLRLLHTADVHLGARHADLGEAAAAQRERQFAAFRASVDLALAEKVDLFLVAGRPVRLEHPAPAVRRARGGRARAPRRGPDPDGHHPGHPRRLRPLVDLPRLRPRGPRRHAPDGRPGHGPRRPTARGPPAALDAVVHGPRASRRSGPRTARSGTWPPSTRRRRPPGGSASLHAAIAIPGRTDDDEVVITTDEIAASGLDYLALGHWHSAQTGRAGDVTYAYAGRPGAGRGGPGPGRQGAPRRRSTSATAAGP